MKKNTFAIFFFLSISIFLVSSTYSQWVQTNGPEGGRATCLAVNDDYIFTGFYGGGIYRSSNNGVSWSKLTGLLEVGITSLYVSSSNLFAASYGRILKSIDSGLSWSIKSNGLPDNIGVINWIVGNSQKIFIATNQGVYLSANQGELWAAADSGLTSLNVNALLIKDSLLFAGTSGGGISKSTDNGSSWIQVNTGLTSQGISALGIWGNRIFAAALDGNLFISDNNGNNWTLSNSPEIDQIHVFSTFGSQIAAGGIGSEGKVLYISSDGYNWTNISNGLQAKDIRGIIFKDSKILAGCYYSGIYSKPDSFNEEWNQINHGILASSVSKLVTEGENIFCGTLGNGVFFSSDEGNSWIEKNIGLNSLDVKDLTIGNTKIFIATDRGINLSTNKGEEWQQVGPQVLMTSVITDSNKVYAGTSGQIYFSSDGGINWFDRSNGIPNNSNVYCFGIQNENVYAGTSKGIFISSNDGKNWSDVSNGLSSKDIRSTAIVNSNIFVGTYDSGVWKSSDKGNSWIKLTNLYPIENINALIVRGNDIFATSYTRIFHSADSGNSWLEVESDFINSIVTSLTYNNSNLFAGTEGSGVWRKPLSEIINYTVSVETNPIGSGNISGAHTYSHGSTVTLTAVPNENYKFVNWSEGDSVVSSDNPYKFTILDDKALTANFEIVPKISFDSAYVEVSADSGSGSFQVLNSTGNVMPWSAASNSYWVTITGPDTGTNDGTINFKFAQNLTEARKGKIQVNAPNASNNPQVFEVRQAAAQYNIILISSPDSGGTVKGSAKYDYGKSITVTAIPNSGWNFKNWTEDSITVSTDSEYKFIVSKNLTLTANFVPIPKLSVLPDFINVPEDSGSASFIVNNLTGETMIWTAVSNNQWITIISGAEGVNNDTIKIIYEGNKHSARTGTVTITAPGAIGSPITVEIRQAKMLDTLTILHLNDTHSMLAPGGPRSEDLKGTNGGIARAATVIGLTKKSDRKVLTLHGGDVFIGDLFFNKYFGIAEFKIMNALGFDAMVLGNHEFDLGPGVLQMAFDSSISNGGFDVISSNTILDAPEVQALKKYVKPFTIKNFGNVKVGIFGLTTPSANLLSQPSPAVIDTNIEACITNSLKELTVNKCNIIILLSHLGKNYDQQIAATVPGINLIVSAHDHLTTEKPVEIKNPSGELTYIVQAGAFYYNIGKLKFVIDTGKVSLLSYELIHLDQNIPEEPEVAANVTELINGIEAAYGEMYSQQVGYAENTFEEESNTNGFYSTAAGNLITDAFKAKTGTDIAITVGGAISQPLYKGPIVAADVFRMIGYGFNEVNTLGYRLVKFNITSPDLWTALQMCLSQTVSDDEFFPQVSGMKFGYINTGSGLQLTEAAVNNVPLGPVSSAVYTVTTNEYLAYALQNLFGIQISNLYTYNDSTEFQAVLDYIISKGGTISPDNNSRITSVERPNDQAGVIRAFKLEQNYPNPFNPSTNFEFVIPVNEMVTLKIYDILGREVALLINENLPAGKYKYRWDAGRLASGVYIYKLKAGSYSSMKKLILLK